MSAPDALRPRRRPTPSRGRRRRARRERPPGRRPVDDEHRHGGRRRDGAPGRAARPGRLAARAGHRQHTRPPPRPSRRWSARSATSASTTPIVGDFHYNGHKLLVEYPEAARGPGEVPHQPGQRRRQAPRRELPDDRPGRRSSTTSRSGSASTGARSTRPLLTDADGGERPARRAARRPRRDDRGDAPVGPPLGGAGRGDRACATTGSSSAPRCPACATSSTSTGSWPPRCDYPLHLGLTEAGMGMKGIVASTAGLAILLNEGIGDTIRVSLTPEPGAGRELEVEVAQQVLQSLGLRSLPAPGVAPARAAAGRRRRSSRRWPATSRRTSRTGCPSGARPTRAWRSSRVAVMGCVVNGPGREQARRHRDQPARARSRSRSRRSSSTGSSTTPSAATTSWSASSALLEEYVEPPLPDRGAGLIAADGRGGRPRRPRRSRPRPAGQRRSARTGGRRSPGSRGALYCATTRPRRPMTWLTATFFFRSERARRACGRRTTENREVRA